ncbi:MFS transporter [Desulfovibrio sp.]|uniref:MFS transporter n=1 Tax=Desulfovibrio sp. TaxID=885 RepID=UPI0025BFA456|nr:MFS transporter [Desulfovibrio sp.]
MDKKKILLLSLGHLSCDVNGGALPAVLPFLRASYGLSYQATGGLMFAYSCLSSIIQPLFGWLSDRFSKPWFIPLGVLLAGCGLAAVGFMRDYWAIFAAITVSGIGAALFHPEGARYANKVSGQSKGVGLSIFSIGGNSGFVLGPLLVTGCVGYFGMSGTAVFACLAVCMAAILLWQIVHMTGLAAGATVVPVPSAPSTESAAGKTPQADAAPVAPVAGGADKDSEILGRNNWREFSKLTVAIVARSTLFVGFNTFIPLYWVSAFGQSKAAGALALTFFCTCGVISNIIGGLLSDRYGCTRIIRLAFVLMAPVVFAFSLAGNLYAAFALLPFLGFVLYAPFSSLVVLGQKLLARNIGFASGVTLGLATSMGGMAAPCLGWIADNYGLARAIQCLGLVAVLGALFAFLLSSSKEPDRAQGTAA